MSNALASCLNGFPASVRAEKAENLYCVVFAWEGTTHEIWTRAPDRATLNARVAKTYRGAEVIIAMRNDGARG